MSHSIQPGTEADHLDMAAVMVAALSNDPCWQAMKGSWTDEEEYEFTVETLRATMASGFPVGTYKCWKVVNENGCFSL